MYRQQNTERKIQIGKPLDCADSCRKYREKPKKKQMYQEADDTYVCLWIHQSNCFSLVAPLLGWSFLSDQATSRVGAFAYGRVS
jgi:hypothetical protein